MNATNFVRRFVAILAVGAAAWPAMAQHSEHPNQPPMPQRVIRTSPPGGFATAGTTTTQVNVDSQGKNIVGDAANEPSIAVDPTAPNRMVIGWRQFDNVVGLPAIGVRLTNDGGRTWHPRRQDHAGRFGATRA
jgi:hypothetical protein